MPIKIMASHEGGVVFLTGYLEFKAGLSEVDRWYRRLCVARPSERPAMKGEERVVALSVW